MDPEAPRNRKERRAAARQDGGSVEAPKSMPKIKMGQPDRSKPRVKTLMDIYEEKKALLDQSLPDHEQNDTLFSDNDSGNIFEAGLGDGEPIGPIGDAVFWSVCLSMFHFTLDVLVYNQYAQSILWPEIFKRSIIVVPVMFLVIYMMRSKTAKRVAIARQLLFLAASVASGCYLIHAGNNFEYLAVMKQAPPLGTLWVWSVIELDLPFALASVVVDLGYLWWKGYSAF